MTHTFTVRVPTTAGETVRVKVNASTREQAAAWLDRSGYIIVHTFTKR